MAFSIRKRNERQQKTEHGLLETSLMQNLQDRFCDANNVYLVCLSSGHGVITKSYGSKEELSYIHSLINMDMYVALLHRLMAHEEESVLEQKCENEFIKMCGISIRMNGEIAAAWIVIGIMEQAQAEIPDCIMRTTLEHYYKSVELLETISTQMFAAKTEELLAHEAFRKSRESESKMKSELRRNEAMASIVGMLESDASIEDIMKNILKVTCRYLDISTGLLMCENVQKQWVELICDYTVPELESTASYWEHTPVKQMPFFDGKVHIISAESMMPDEFYRFFSKKEISAGIFFPMDIAPETYLVFCEKQKKRIWDMGDIQFAVDVKRIAQSILVKRAAEESLANSYASLDAVLEKVECAVYVKDPDSNEELYANRYFRELFEELMLESKNQKSGVPYYALEKTVQEIYIDKLKRWFDIQHTYISWIDKRNAVLYTIYDVTEKKIYQQKIEKQANNDLLTGLYNRVRCQEDLKKCILETVEKGEEGALLYIDLDDFKHINEGLGHQYGDILLKNISIAISRIEGVSNQCYRMGGDEFIIIISHIHMPMLEHILREIEFLFSQPWTIKDTDCYCTMSMGIVCFPKHGNTVEEVMRKADIALYRAKCSGKNRVEIYCEKGEEGTFKRLDLEKNMRNAMRDAFREFEVCYQPIVDMQKPGWPCVGAEALIRWHSREMGMISPSEFIPLAEYLGLINPIGDFVLKEACEHCKYWNQNGYPEYKVHVNLSVIQLLQNDIVEKIQLILNETGLEPKNLVLEVTEGLAINDMNRMRSILASIQKLGAEVALDDFGTGYSSLNHIREMPIDVIKIDRCFVTDIGKDEFSGAFVKMVSELADAIGVKVCVEGVETKEQAYLLKNMKIQMIQGYYFGRPMKIEKFEERYIKK